jgi:hypothetical protein
VNKKYDWDSIEKQYIRGDMGLRELARLNGIVMVQSSKNDWARKRDEYRAQTSAKAITYMATDEAKRIAQEARVRDNAIEAIDEAITKMRADMQATTLRYKNGEWVEEPLVVIKPTDVALLIDRLNVLFGRPSTISEERSLGVNLSAGGTLGPDILRSIVEATRGITDTGDAARSPIPRIGDPREN